jgi:hypothetical protein
LFLDASDVILYAYRQGLVNISPQFSKKYSTLLDFLTRVYAGGTIGERLFLTPKMMFTIETLTCNYTPRRIDCLGSKHIFFQFLACLTIVVDILFALYAEGAVTDINIFTNLAVGGFRTASSFC